MRKVAVVVTARASYCRVKTLLEAIMNHPGLTLQLVLIDEDPSCISSFTQNVKQNQLPIDSIIVLHRSLDTISQTALATAFAIEKLVSVFEKLNPQVVLTIADRHETMATAIAASYSNIPLAHLQGGEVTGNLDEKVRHAVTKLADLHFVATDQARRRVIQLGERPETVFQTGCPAMDVAWEVSGTCDTVLDLTRPVALGDCIDRKEPYLVVLQHPVTTELALVREQIERTLRAVSSMNLPSYWFAPNQDPGNKLMIQIIRQYSDHHPDANMHLLYNMEPVSFLRLVNQSLCLIGNSSTGIREGAALGAPVVNIGSRQAGRERGVNVMDCGHDEFEIRTAIRKQLAHGRYPPDTLYGNGGSGRRIADLLATVPLSFDKKLTY